MDKRLERILPRVQKPARYVGGEYNAVMKDKARVDTRVAFCFPDTALKSYLHKDGIVVRVGQL